MSSTVNIDKYEVPALDVASLRRYPLFSYFATVGLFGVLAVAASASPITLSTLNLVGTAQLVSSTVLRLTPNYETNPGANPGDPPLGDPPAGAAWTPNMVNVVDPFAVSFNFQMSDAIRADRSGRRQWRRWHRVPDPE